MSEQESPLKADLSVESSSASLPPDLRAVGETKLISLISSHSAESDVWLGERADGRRVAVKIYRYGRIPGLIEADQKCALVHPSLVPVIEAGEVAGRYYEMSPFIPGGTLANLIQRHGRLSEPEVEAVLDQLSEVIHYLHSRHVLHRDVKPTNVFVLQESPLRVALADFGTARLGAYQTMLTGTIGTIAYSSPEAVTGIQSEAADYWSLGTVLLEALTGRRPLEGLDVKQQLYRVASGKIEIPEALSARWKALLAGLLQADYTERWRKQEIERWQKTRETISTHQDGKSTQSVRQSSLDSSPAILDRSAQVAEDDTSRAISNKPRPLSTAGEKKAPIPRRTRALLVREPETIQLRASEVTDLVFNRAFAALSQFFWLAFFVSWHRHNAVEPILLLGTIAAIGVGIGFLPHRLERLKREVRVNRQLATYSQEDRHFLRRLARSWMRSLRRRRSSDD